jgi:hypothetical protein
MRAKTLCVVACLFGLLLAGCGEIKNVTPSWWDEAQVESFSLGEQPEIVIGKEPLVRLMALSILWSWVLFGWLSFSKPSLKGRVLFSPIIVWGGVWMACLFVLPLLYMVSYMITGTGYIMDFSFVFFNVLGLTVAWFAFALVEELVHNLNGNRPPLIAFLLFLTVWSYIFTSRDVVDLMLYLVRQ